MIEAVIFDFGGVFTTSPFEAFAAYERKRGLPADLIKRINGANYLDNAWARFERAEIDLDAFDTLFAEEASALRPSRSGQRHHRVARGRFPPRNAGGAETHQDEIQNRLHHQQCAVQPDGLGGWPHIICARDHGAVRSFDRILEGRICANPIRASIR